MVSPGSYKDVLIRVMLLTCLKPTPSCSQKWSCGFPTKSKRLQTPALEFLLLSLITPGSTFSPRWVKPWTVFCSYRDKFHFRLSSNFHSASRAEPFHSLRPCPCPSEMCCEVALEYMDQSTCLLLCLCPCNVPLGLTATSVFQVSQEDRTHYFPSPRDTVSRLVTGEIVHRETIPRSSPSRNRKPASWS